MILIRISTSKLPPWWIDNQWLTLYPVYLLLKFKIQKKSPPTEPQKARCGGFFYFFLIFQRRYDAIFETPMQCYTSPNNLTESDPLLHTESRLFKCGYQTTSSIFSVCGMHILPTISEASWPHVWAGQCSGLIHRLNRCGHTPANNAESKKKYIENPIIKTLC